MDTFVSKFSLHNIENKFVIVFIDGNETSDNKFKEENEASNLNFIEVSMTDTGTYICVASSPGFPNAVAETKLNVRGTYFSGGINF